MELHSYAKRKVSKKWTIEQKRKLVEARISNDAVFYNKPSNSVVPWKKVLSLAKLDDYNVFFVRKQWSNMIAKYKQYKQIRLGNISSRAIDDEMIQRITQEWEFFYPIHRFMTRKTTNLHSYALTAEQEPASSSPSPPPQQEVELEEEEEDEEEEQEEQEQQHPPNSNSSTERINAFSSDTNEDYNGPGCSSSSAAAAANQFQIRNTDHDFYSKTEAAVNRLHYFADASEEDTQESMIVELTAPYIAHDRTEYATKVEAAAQIMEPNLAVETPPQMKEEVQQDDDNNSEAVAEMPQAANQAQEPKTEAAQKECGAGDTQRECVKRKLSERDKYYRHKRRFNRRLEQRFDSILNVFGQIIKAEYPSVDVNPILGATSATGAMVAKLFSSDEEINTSDEEGAEELAKQAHASTTDANKNNNTNKDQQE